MVLEEEEEEEAAAEGEEDELVVAAAAAVGLEGVPLLGAGEMEGEGAEDRT